MYRRIFILAFTIFTAHFALAQKTYIGIKSGISRPAAYEEFEPYRISKKARKKVPIFGIAYRYQIKPFFALNGETFFEERGWYTVAPFALDSNGFTVDGGKIKFCYSFITTPLLLETSIGKNLRVFSNVGINPSWRIGGKTIQDDPNIDPNLGVYPTTLKPMLDFGFLYGGGVSFHHKRLFFQAEYRYFKSRTPVGLRFIEDRIHHYGEMLTFKMFYGFDSFKKAKKS